MWYAAKIFTPPLSHSKGRLTLCALLKKIIECTNYNDKMSFIYSSTIIIIVVNGVVRWIEIQ